MSAHSFVIRAMTENDAHAISGWRYDGIYAFYDAVADRQDLAELLDPAQWGTQYFAADAGQELVGFFVFKLGPDAVAEVGLGLRPDLTGQGIGQRFVDAGLRYAAHALGAAGYVLAVAAFNERAIAVYRRAGFAEIERYQHRTNGGEHEFVRMTRGRCITHGTRA